MQLPGENVDENTLFQLQGLIAKGNALYHSGRHKEAYDYFSNAINKSTGCLKSLNEISPAGKMLLSNLYNRRAASANKLQNYEQVIYDATEMIVLGFQIEKGHVRKGGALLMAGQPGEAVKEYKEALKLNPDNAAYKQYLKEAQEKCGGQSEPAPPPAPLSCPEVQRQNKIHDRTKQGNKVFFAEKPDYVGALDHYDSALKEVGEGEKSDKPTAAIKHNLLGRRAQTLKKLQRFQVSPSLFLNYSVECGYRRYAGNSTDSCRS